MNAAEYLKQSEDAAKQLFAGLDTYFQLLKKDPRPTFVYSGSANDPSAREKALDEWLAANDQAIKKSLEVQREYFGLTFSEATLAGAVLQIAAQGLNAFSTNAAIPESWANHIKPDAKSVRFCVGRGVKRVPLGLVILAARNQYAHWDEQEPHKLTAEVFRRLSRVEGHPNISDPAFDLSNRQLHLYGHNVLSLIGWKSYDAYRKDMGEMLGA